MRRRLLFSEVDGLCKRQPGIYEVHTRLGLPLKVGIAADLRKRLRQHRASRQGALKLKPGGTRANPTDVLSKESILAKHLYYDAEIAPAYDLTRQSERQRFLDTECIVLVEATSSRVVARELECAREVSGEFRYVGRVRVRP